MAAAEVVGTVEACWRYPVKSLQGLTVESLEIAMAGVVGDRAHALLDGATGRVMSAKRTSELLQAGADDTAITLPDGTIVAFDDPEADRQLSDWLDRPVTLAAAGGTEARSYEMTFDPPDDGAEYFEIPIPVGTFLDLSPLHVVTTATLDGCARLRPDLDWDRRRFRPNLVLDVDAEVFVEDAWCGRRLRFSSGAELEVLQPTVRCAMPLRAQPGLDGDRGPLDRQAELFSAMSELHEAFPNHLGIYADVAVAGSLAVGDTVELV